MTDTIPAGRTPLLRVEDLSVALPRKGGQPVSPVRGVSFVLGHGQRLGLVGESGSGKSLTALALLRLLHEPVTVRGRVLLSGRDLLRLSAREMADVRARRMSLIYQDPMSALNPVFSIGRQIVEAIRLATRVSRRDARTGAIELLGDVGVAEPRRRIDSYPHEFSGGMRQRVVIAMALASNPDVLIADEPTTALDVTTQGLVMDLLSRIVAERGLSVVLITHDLGVAAGFCDEIGVMYSGRVVERASIDDIYSRPVHPYTEALLGAVCRLDTDVTRPMPAIEGQPPRPDRLPTGCTFHPRCRFSAQRCAEEIPQPVQVTGARFAECHLAAARAASFTGGDSG